MTNRHKYLQAIKWNISSEPLCHAGSAVSVKEIKTAQFVVMSSNGIDWWRVVHLALETSPCVAGKQNLFLPSG